MYEQLFLQRSASKRSRKNIVLAAGACLAACQPGAADAAPFESNMCAVVIASGSTLIEVHDWLVKNPRYEVDVIYAASNGYYAVSAGLIQKDNWRDRVEHLKRVGLVPGDAYCSAKGIVSIAATDADELNRRITAERASVAAQRLAEVEAARAAAERAAEQSRALAEASEARAREAEQRLAKAEARESGNDEVERPQVERGSRLDDAGQPQGGRDDDGIGVIKTGTGFRVAKDGSLITNWHVVSDCKSLAADGVPVSLVQQSTTFDLAILRPDSAYESKAWLPLSAEPPRLNSDVIVAGYPLYGLLGGINVTRGTVTSLRGMGGDDSTMQISAPIQNGNSGGAVADRYGRVVGVVVAKLDGDALREIAGVGAENVNFAVRGDILRLMLDRYDVEYDTAAATGDISPEDLADRLTSATALVVCQ